MQTRKSRRMLVAVGVMLGLILVVWGGGGDCEAGADVVTVAAVVV